jgi:hypothetical protein
LKELMVQGLHLYDIWLALGEPDSRQMALEMIYLDDMHYLRRPTAYIGCTPLSDTRPQRMRGILGSVRLSSLGNGCAGFCQRWADAGAAASGACEQERAYCRSSARVDVLRLGLRLTSHWPVLLLPDYLIAPSRMTIMDSQF